MKNLLMFCSSRSSSRGSTTRSHALPQSTSLVKSYRTESQESVNSDKTGANDDDKRPRGICINHLPIRSTGLWSVHFSVFFAVLISWRIIPNAKTAKKFIVSIWKISLETLIAYFILRADTSLRDGLFHEYKKYGKVNAVLVAGVGEERYAIVSFRK